MKNKTSSKSSPSIEQENEFLRLKLMAESGTEPQISANTPPWIENMFLKNVLAFEKQFHHGARASIAHILGNPEVPDDATLSDQEVANRLAGFEQLLLERGIAVCFSGEYDDRLKYNFITRELFLEEVTVERIGRMTLYFHYEEFHPNHRLDIETRSKKFLSAWFNRNLEEIAWELDDEIIVSAGASLAKSEVMRLVKQFVNKHRHFTNYSFGIHDVIFEIRDDTGMGYADGNLIYTAIARDGTEHVFSGPFRLFFCMDYHWWNLYSFILPGFDSAA